MTDHQDERASLSSPDGGEAANAANGLEPDFASRSWTKREASRDNPSGRKLQTKWDQMYKRLVAFKKKHGHCLVPNRYSDDPKLGSWVSTQRRHYRILTSGTAESTSTPMTTSRVQKLIDIGFKWSTRDPRHVPWEQRYNELVSFKNKYGHSQVPIGWEENGKLSNWVSTQRQEYKQKQRGRQSRLDEDRIEKLNKLNFVWEAQRGGARRKLKAAVVVPPKANPVDSSRIRAKLSAKAEKKRMLEKNLVTPTLPGEGGSTNLIQRSCAIPVVGPHVAALSAANPGLLPHGGAIHMTMPMASQQWQVLPNGTYQRNGTDSGLSSSAFFPMATQLPVARTSFQFSADPSMVQRQVIAYQQPRQQQPNRTGIGSGHILRLHDETEAVLPPQVTQRFPQHALSQVLIGNKDQFRNETATMGVPMMMVMGLSNNQVVVPGSMIVQNNSMTPVRNNSVMLPNNSMAMVPNNSVILSNNSMATVPNDPSVLVPNNSMATVPTPAAVPNHQMPIQTNETMLVRPVPFQNVPANCPDGGEEEEDIFYDANG